jgi:hypothetical protein
VPLPLRQKNSITNEIIAGRRPSTAIVRVARPRARRNDPQQMLPGDFSQDRAEPNKLVNDIRLHVGRWRQGGHSGVTATTRRLPDRSASYRESVSSIFPETGWPL